jgi:hypothetical protein
MADKCEIDLELHAYTRVLGSLRAPLDVRDGEVSFGGAGRSVGVNLP